ncbi:hypothetical protein MCOR29_004587 [Pyricularia oryzae]|uniref:Uncharacterized protein n=1 Tax=Pyricularia grisea TaxID=148305 RepID=A0ABQ8NQ72_PYRGI|nr:hypothetical protein MCOR33_003851 [Pyricularia grisea]KAI6322887.1 hypothetical protein MCOR29_004587 [Pyricularia oryzae]KAI6371560.1 hypothetical protein MCOR32_006166 [Pyricularia oryzae]KAI6399342.1 hypothetical protein MCOR23_005311 [Pyricularia oryzae]KAI6531884.1 hypothetical protein MCOR05_007235 [Pyricularia oryzae]
MVFYLHQNAWSSSLSRHIWGTASYPVQLDDGTTKQAIETWPLLTEDLTFFWLAQHEKDVIDLASKAVCSPVDSAKHILPKYQYKVLGEGSVVMPLSRSSIART